MEKNINNNNIYIQLKKKNITKQNTERCDDAHRRVDVCEK
jgi:hypothetical protein